jgi:monomeric sarcosine oxidase
MDVIVIGAGAFGAWTAYHLLSGGARVTLVDAYGPANSRASSGDESRIIRCGYGPDEIYSRWARRSLSIWRDLRAQAGGAPLFHACGVLWMSSADDPYTLATRDTLQLHGHPVHLFDTAALRTRYPHLIAADVPLALLEPDCGVVMARRAVQTLVADLVARGVRLLRGRVTVPSAQGRLRAVRTTDGGELRADAFVFACGAWLPKVFPELLEGRIRPTRQVVMYFGSPAGDDRFGPARTPAWVDFAAGIYGVPDLEDRGLKVGLDRHGPLFDPDTSDRVVDAQSIATARDWLRRRFPALADAPILESRICQYENTSTGDFLLDRHPELKNVWVAGGGSGHGFKHGPVVGEYMASLVRGLVEPEPRFLFATKGVEANRSVF